MTQINQFKCNSCGHEADATWNGEHFLPPKGWIALVECTTAGQCGHLCDICSYAAVNHSLRETFRKWFKRHFKGTEHENV